MNSASIHLSSNPLPLNLSWNLSELLAAIGFRLSNCRPPKPKFMNNYPVKVLLIDDDEEDYILTRYVFDEFKDNQFKLDWIDNFEDGLKALNQNRHDIYLVDYRLGD